MDNFYKVSWALASCKAIKKTHLLLLADTLSFNEQGMVNYKSQTTMARDYGVTRKTVNNAIGDLKKLGLLKVTEQGDSLPLMLEVNKDNLIAYVEKNRGDKKVTDGSKKSYIGGDKKVTQKEHIKEHIKEHPLPLHFSDSQKECVNFSQDLESLSDKEQKTAKAKKPLFTDQLRDSDYPFCNAASSTLKWMKVEEGFFNIYLGSQEKDVWDSCEYKLREIYDCNEYYDEISSPQELTDRLLWNIYTDRKLYEKDTEIGLPFLLDPDSKSMSAEVMAGCDYLDFLREI